MASLVKRLSQSMGRGSMTEAQKGFKSQLGNEQLNYFNDVANKPFSQQAIAFLNVYWQEVGDQAEFIFSAAYPTMTMADMRAKGVSLIHLYEEGVDLDFNIGLYFYEQLCKKVLDSDKPEDRRWREDPHFAPSMPEMQTAIIRKKEIREKVDVNFDGKISFLEYLLYQYRAVTNPAEFARRGIIANSAEPPNVIAARVALEEVNEKIRAYEAEKARLTELSKQDGVKGLSAKHQLTMLVKSPIAEELQVALIKAEAAVRLAVRTARKEGGGEDANGPNAGALWWMNRDLQHKKEMYGRVK